MIVLFTGIDSTSRELLSVFTYCSLNGLPIVNTVPDFDSDPKFDNDGLPIPKYSEEDTINVNKSSKVLTDIHEKFNWHNDFYNVGNVISDSIRPLFNKLVDNIKAETNKIAVIHGYIDQYVLEELAVTLKKKITVIRLLRHPSVGYVSTCINVGKHSDSLDLPEQKKRIVEYIDSVVCTSLYAATSNISVIDVQFDTLCQDRKLQLPTLGIDIDLPDSYTVSNENKLTAFELSAVNNSKFNNYLLGLLPDVNRILSSIEHSQSDLTLLTDMVAGSSDSQTVNIDEVKAKRVAVGATNMFTYFGYSTPLKFNPDTLEFTNT